MFSSTIFLWRKRIRIYGVATGQGKAEQENRYTDDVVWERVTVSAATVGLSQT